MEWEHHHASQAKGLEPPSYMMRCRCTRHPFQLVRCLHLPIADPTTLSHYKSKTCLYIYMWVIKGPVFGLRTCRDVIGFPHLMHHLQGRTSPFPHSCHPGIGAKRIFEKMEPQTSNGLQPTSDGLYGSKTIQNHEPPKRTTSPKCRTSRQRCLLSKDLLQLQQPL